MANERIELVSSEDSPTGVAGRMVNGEFQERGIVPGETRDPVSADPSVVTSDSFVEEQDFDLSGVDTTGTLADGELARFESQVEDTEKTLAERTQEQAAQREQTAETSIGDFLRTHIEQPTESELRQAAETQTSVGGQSFDEIRVEVNDLNNQIRAEQRALQNKVRTLEKNREGVLAGALQDRIEDAKTESIRRQADLAIIQQAALGKLDIAKDIADRAVNAQLERQQLVLDVKRFVAEKNWQLFTQSEQRSFQLQLAEEERQLANEREDMLTLQNTKLEAIRMAQLNGAPASVLKSIQEAETPEDVYAVGGRYASVDILERTLMQEKLNALREEPDNLAPTQVIDQGGRKMLINTQTGEVIKDFGVSDVGTNELEMASIQTKIDQMDELKAHSGMRKAVGPTRLGRFTPFRVDVSTGDVADFKAGVDKLTKNLTLDNLIRAKDQGATFGALSDSELRILSESASKINSWRVEKDGRTSHYEASENDFMEELDRISNFAKLDAYLKGADSDAIGVVETPDGKLWAKNGDGTLTQLR